MTGLRITPFPFSPDWSSAVKERIEYKTSRTVARTGAEQRARLRLRPRRGLSFDVANLDVQEAQSFDSLVWDRGGEMFAVPWWPDQVRYSGTLAAGATSIAIDTTNRLFSLAPMVMIWSDWNACEVQSVESVSAGLVACSTLAVTYTSPLILPAFPGRLKDGAEVVRATSRISQGTVEFACEVGASDVRPSPSTPTQAYGFDVLEVSPNWDAPKSSAKRVLYTLDNGMAPAYVRDRGGVSFQSHDFRWFLDGHAEVQAFRNFVDRRAGSLTPFWVPTWREDFTVAQAALSSSTGIVTKSIGYASLMFPDRARRYVAIRDGGAWIYRKVTGASDNGTTETLTFDATLGTNIAAGTPVALLALCRLESDSTEIAWSTDRFGEAVTTFVELPQEVPA